MSVQVSENLIPKGEREINAVRAVLAAIRGQTVILRDSHDTCLADVTNDLAQIADGVYKIEPRATPLPITPEMWALIDRQLNCAAMDKDGVVFFYPNNQMEKTNSIWSHVTGAGFENYFAINTDGIQWDKSLTERPVTNTTSGTIKADKFEVGYRSIETGEFVAYK